jgi:nicotinamide-nucleotide amidase
VAAAGPDGAQVRRLSLPGDRAAVRAAAVTAALDLLAERLRAAAAAPLDRGEAAAAAARDREE